MNVRGDNYVDTYRHILSLASQNGAFDSMIEHWRLFDDDQPPTAPDPTMVRMVESILAHVADGADSEADSADGNH